MTKPHTILKKELARLIEGMPAGSVFTSVGILHLLNSQDATSHIVGRMLFAMDGIEPDGMSNGIRTWRRKDDIAGRGKHGADRGGTPGMGDRGQGDTAGRGDEPSVPVCQGVQLSEDERKIPQMAEERSREAGDMETPHVRPTSYGEAIDSVVRIGEVLTVPEISDRISVYYPDQLRNTVRSKVHHYVSKSVLYGRWKEEELQERRTGTNRAWKRLM